MNSPRIFLIICVLARQSTGQSRETCSTSGGKVGQCRPLVKCVRFVHEIPVLREQPCVLTSGENGVCCPHIIRGVVPIKTSHRRHRTPQSTHRSHPPNHITPLSPIYRQPQFIYYFYNQNAVRGSRRSNRVLRRPPRPQVPRPPIRTNDINRAAQRSTFRRENRIRIEQNLRRAGLVGSSGLNTAAAKHRRLQRAKPRVRKLGRKALRLEEASEELKQDFQLTPAQGTHSLPVFSLVGTSFEVKEDEDDEVCNEIVEASGERQRSNRKCRTVDPKYRTIDGSCNNEVNSNWGQANIALQRLLHPVYEDGLSAPRGQNSLPSPRSITESMIPDQNIPSQDFTLLLMQWGQFLDHDLTHTPLVKAEDDSDIFCCSNGQELQGDLRHPECLPIQISPTDSFFGKFGQRCMEFVRSMPARNADCNLGPREQVNQITAFIDGSNVYGSDNAEARTLRLGRRGRLRVTKFRNEELLPLNPEECADHSNREYCFAAGDSRCNEQPQLTVMHTLWLREHNRIASQLSLLNSHWDDEKLYQETRKIVGAEMQHITFNEWLPIILGIEYMEENNLTPLKSGFTSDYDKDIEPSITSSFATAAFRFGHSLVQGNMDWIGEFGNQLKSLQLHRHQLSPFEIYKDKSVDGLLRGLTSQPAQNMDASFSKELTERLFQEPNSTHGMDLVALNIQRGRDHGLPPYVNYRRLCGLPEISSWRELTKIVGNPQIVPRIQRMYRSVRDIDLFLGGIIESPASGSILGPTFRCLVGDQFKRLKWGDKFWYEEGEEQNSFTKEQLAAIRESNMARIICDNGENIQLMQPLAFKVAEGMNSKAACNGSKAIPRINLEAWKESGK